MRRMAVATLLALIPLSLAGCSLLRLPDPKYGRAFNAERMRIGLPLIEDNWQPSQCDRFGCVWVNPAREEDYGKHRAVHYSKSQDIRGGALLSEGDTYFGPEDYVVDDGATVREQLGIGYNFQEVEDDPLGGLGWVAWLQDRDGSRQITMEEAEQVLARWGLRRLSYDFPPPS